MTAPAPLTVARGRLFGTVSEVAAILEVDPRTVRHGIAAGTIPAVHVSGGTVRIPWVPFLRDACGLDHDALAALDLPGLAAEHTSGDPSRSPLASVHSLAANDGNSHHGHSPAG